MKLGLKGKTTDGNYTYRIILAVICLLLFAERMYVMCELGVKSVVGADDTSYIESGIVFKNTAIITYGTGLNPTGLIMPGMTVTIGLASMIFGEGFAFMAALKILWCTMGVINAVYVNKAVNVFAPKWCGLLAACCFLLPNQAWMNNIIHTETPYSLFFTMSIYYTLQMGKSSDRKYFVGYLISFLMALFYRTNIVTMAFFTPLYVVIVRKTARWKELFARAALMAAVTALLLTPWTIRNYIHFGDFIPFTYGVGNPMLLGTYYDGHSPADDELDYETNVYAVLREEYSEYFDENGNLRDEKHTQYISLKTDEIMAKYRMEEWFKKDPKDFLKHYLFIKPTCVINWVWYWSKVMGVEYEAMVLASKMNAVLCAAAVMLSLLIKNSAKSLSC